jgi:hypothetical protein
MASMGDMPNVARNIMSCCSGHGLYNNGFLGLKKRIIGRIQGIDSALFISLSRTCRGPTPAEPAEGERPDVMDDTLPSRNDTPVRQAILDFAAEAGESFRDI